MLEKFFIDRDLSVFYKEHFYERLVCSAKIPFLFFDLSLFKFNSYICAVYFNFSESTHFFVLDLGLKARLSFPFKNIREKYPRKLRDSVFFF
jgi:hypothetical protein